MTPPPAAPGPRHPAPPGGWRRTAARLPVHLFRVGLGPLFRKRLLLLVHTGRVTGEQRRTVLEVVAAERVDGRRAWTVASGFGARAHWYRNLRAAPQAVAQVGRVYHAVSARFLTPEEGGRSMTGYAERHPRTARRLCAYLGHPVDGGTEDYRRAGEVLPFVLLVEDHP
ncbi:nitroreductase family deazaflavin-dependent oxidoreductase [Streptomyces halstedii]|uniref:nitroreductase family deazaflavin-dependent oxidoreductase n=1 Tax=Streptomyces halstedii TaxID=1944 RepID=UPI00324B1156